MAKGKKTGGRVAGTPNHLTTALKDMILQALADAGGVEYLKVQAVSNPNAFMALVGRSSLEMGRGLDGWPVISDGKPSIR